MSTTMTLAQAQQEVVDEFAMFTDWQDRYEHLIELGKDLPLIAPENKTEENIVTRLPKPRMAQLPRPDERAGSCISPLTAMR